jgi:hypothetical protein
MITLIYDLIISIFELLCLFLIFLVNQLIDNSTFSSSFFYPIEQLKNIVYSNSHDVWNKKSTKRVISLS